jgi:hypothetical protein
MDVNQVVIQAVDEVENPVILSTLAVIDTISFCTEKPGPSPRNGIFDGPSLSRIAGVRGRWLCLGVLCLKSQIQNTKLQINLKLQITNSKQVQRAAQVLAPRERLFLFGF